MPYFYPGYAESRDNLYKMTDAELLGLLDDLFGREQLPDDYTHDDLLAEALRQHKEEWTDKGSQEYERVRFHVNAIKIMQRQGIR